MSYIPYETQYFNGLDKILNHGVICVSGRQSDADNTVRTKRVWGVSMTVDLEKEFPVLKSKHVAVKSAIREILWIMRKQSNNIHDLIPHIWDKWADEDGSIGKAYGYQVHKPVRFNGRTYDSQVHYVLESLQRDPSSRKAVIDLWSPEELDEMGLTPCCYTSHFAVLGGRLNCMLTQRSGDYLVGVPFNTTQYAALTIMFARHLGLLPGILIHNISDAHIYESQYGNFYTLKQEDGMNENFKTFMDNYERLQMPGYENMLLSRPQLIINREDTDFFSIGDHDFEVTGYKTGVNCFGDIPFDVIA